MYNYSNILFNLSIVDVVIYMVVKGFCFSQECRNSSKIFKRQAEFLIMLQHNNKE